MYTLAKALHRITSQEPEKWWYSFVYSNATAVGANELSTAEFRLNPHYKPRIITCLFLLHYAPVAQLDRVAGSDPVGRGFESLRARH